MCRLCVTEMKLSLNSGSYKNNFNITITSLSHPFSFQTVCGDLRGVSQSSACRAVLHSSEHLAQQLRNYVQFPNSQEEFDRRQRKFYGMGHFPNVSGCIDCTHIPIKNPGGPMAEVYRNRKGFFSLNIQCVAGPDLEICDIVIRWPGSAHDSRIFDNSFIKLRFDEQNMKGFLLGDAGYAQSNYCFTPVPDPRTAAEERYNRAHKTTRRTVERMFGVWKKKFPCLSRKLSNKVRTTTRIIAACAVLHNIGILHDNAFVEDEAIEIDPVPVQNAENNMRHMAVRQAFIERHFVDQD